MEPPDHTRLSMFLSYVALQSKVKNKVGLPWVLYISECVHLQTNLIRFILLAFMPMLISGTPFCASNYDSPYRYVA